MATLTRAPIAELRHAFPTRLPSDLWQALRQRAEQERVTVSYALELSLREGLARHRKPE